MKKKVIVTTCRECGGELKEGDCYPGAVRVHKACLPGYMFKKRRAGDPARVAKNWWEEPLPEKDGGLFDYETYFKKDGYSTILTERPYGPEIFTPRYKFGAKKA